MAKAPAPIDGTHTSASRGIFGTSLRLRNVLMVLTMLAGMGLMVGPTVITDNQDIIGATIVGLSLFGFVFLNTPGLDFKTKVENNRPLLGAIILLTGFGTGVTFLWDHGDLEGVGIMGMIILVTSLVGTNLLSPETQLGSHEVRTAITLSCFAMFYAFIGFAGDEPVDEGSILAETFEHFWQVLIAVVGFYFGGITVERLADRRKEMPRESSGDES